jgi:hypothetical protein
VLEVLGNAVDSLVGTDVSSLDDASLHALVIELPRQLSRLQALQSLASSVWSDRGVWSDDGSRSAGHRLARETGLSVGDAKHTLHVGRRLSSMPATRDAALAGVLSTSRLEVMVRTNRPDVTAAFCRDEEMLLALAIELPFTDFTRALRYWSEQADESGSKDRASKRHDARRAHCSTTLDSCVDLEALFEPVGGEIFKGELEHIERELFEEDWAEAKAIHGDDVRVEHLKRTPAQRRCDALVEMASRSAGSRAKARPLISVLVDYETFTKTLCETATGIVLNPTELLPLLGRADIERIVFDSKSRVIDVSHKRSFTGALRRAIQVRDRHCQHSSGCDEPAHRCETDHVLAHARNGPTSESNGQLLCKFHNRAKGSGPP